MPRSRLTSQQLQRSCFWGFFFLCIMPVLQQLFMALACFYFKLVAGPADMDLEQARALKPLRLKRPRLEWTAELHKHFVEAMDQLGLENAKPMTITQVAFQRLSYTCTWRSCDFYEGLRSRWVWQRRYGGN